MEPTKTARELIKERGELCEICRQRPGTEAHHCLYRRDRKVKNGILEQKFNLQLVCEICHRSTGEADTYQNRVNFWRAQVERYGLQTMKDWHARVPYKIKEHAYK